MLAYTYIKKYNLRFLKSLGSQLQVYRHPKFQLTPQIPIDTPNSNRHPSSTPGGGGGGSFYIFPTKSYCRILYFKYSDSLQFCGTFHHGKAHLAAAERIMDQLEPTPTEHQVERGKSLLELLLTLHQGGS
jgi:hypothetical protein